MGVQLFELFTEFRHKIEGTEYVFHFKPVLGRADNSAASKASGYKCGGHKRCIFCDASFVSSDVDKLFHYATMSQTFPKDLISIARICQQVYMNVYHLICIRSKIEKQESKY